MSFSYDNFIRPLTGSDRVLKIYGDDGIVVYTINPYSVKSISVYANNIRVSLHSDKVIVISFSSNNEAGLSIGKLRTALDVLQNKQPLFISKEIEEYVKNNVFGPTGSTGPTGATGSTGIQGPQGDDGRSAYEVWTDNGNVGSETVFFDSLKGTSGTSGTSGLADRYNGTSSNTIVVPVQGTKFSFDTQTQLAFVPGQTIYLYNDLVTNYYMLDDYVEDLNSVYILGEVDSYDRNSGSMSIVTIYSQPVGGTYSTWYLTLTGQIGLTGLTGSNGSNGTSGTSGSSGTEGSSGTSGTSGSSGTEGSSGTSGTSGSSGQNGGNAYAVSKYYFQTGNTGSTTGQFDVVGTANFNSITGIYINATDFDGLDFGTYLQGILNSGRTIEVEIKKISDPSRYGIYRLNTATYSGGNLYASSLSVLSSSSNAFESGGAVTYHLSFMSVSSTTNLSLSGNLDVSGTASFNGLSILGETSEILNNYGATASTVVYDFNTGAIWYHGTASTNYTANFTNLPTTNNRALTATIMINQGPTGYSPTIVRIDGVTQSVKWSGGTYSVSTNKVDVVGFTFIRTGSVWAQVFGQISSFS